MLTHILCGNSTASLFSVFHSLSDISLSFAEFPAPCWAPCCDPLMNILYHLNLPAVIPQTAEVLPHESTETSGYTSVLYLICMCLTLKHVFVISFCDTTEDYLLVIGMCFQAVFLIISVGWTGNSKEIK